MRKRDLLYMEWAPIGPSRPSGGSVASLRMLSLESALLAPSHCVGPCGAALLVCYYRMLNATARANPARPKQVLCKPTLRSGTPYGLYITPRFGQSGLWFAHRLQGHLLTLGQRPRASCMASPAAGSLGTHGMLLAGCTGFARAVFIAGVPYALARIPRMSKQAGRSFLGSSSVVPPPPTGAGAFWFS